MNVTIPKEQYEALVRLARRVDMGVEMDCRLRDLFACACQGPLPDCPCVVQKRHIKAAIDGFADMMGYPANPVKLQP